MRIAFFDSGVGGLTVLKAAMERYPSATYLYYADKENVPYGKKTPKEIKRYVSKAVAYLIQQDIDILVIACNTATSVAVKKLRKQYEIPIIGMEPAVKPALLHLDHERTKVLVCATKLTLKLDKLKDLITDLDAGDKTRFLSLQKLVTLAEEGQMDGPEVEKYLKKKLKPIKWGKISALVLGCTHFIYYRDALRRLIPEHVAIIDGNEGTVDRVMHFVQLLQTGADDAGTLSYYDSGVPKPLSEIKPYLDY